MSLMAQWRYEKQSRKCNFDYVIFPFGFLKRIMVTRLLLGNPHPVSPMDQKQRISELTDHFFRNEFGKTVAYLTGKFGPSYLTEAEDAVQEALIKAMQSWPYGRLPNNPTGWIVTVAHNKLIDQIRRRQKVYYTTNLPEESSQVPEISEAYFQDEIIKLMFACCNPRLSPEYQIVLTLRLLGGLSVKEIASALLKKEETIAKALTRAKKKFQQENLSLDIPTTEEIQPRLQRVLKVIYLLFNEGYKSSGGDKLIRRDTCEEAMRLNHILLEKASTNTEWSRSLMALMHFQVSRFDARTNDIGEGISLEHQARDKWDQQHILLGNRYLCTIENGLNNPYFLQAAISGIHANAPSYKETAWPDILKLYDHLYRIQPNPIVALNRIIPLSMVEGPKAALAQLQKLESEKCLVKNHLVPATKAELHLQMNEPDIARKLLSDAAIITDNSTERAFLIKKMRGI